MGHLQSSDRCTFLVRYWPEALHKPCRPHKHAVRFYCDCGLAELTGKTYQSGINRYLSFCCAFDMTSSFPVSNILCCYSVSSLARKASCQQLSAMPRFCVGIPSLTRHQRYRDCNWCKMRYRGSKHMRDSPPRRDFQSLCPYCTVCTQSACPASRATTSSCFGLRQRCAFPNSSQRERSRYRQWRHSTQLSTWGDVSISQDRQVAWVFLKRSKTDQFGRGTEVFLGDTGDEIGPGRQWWFSCSDFLEVAHFFDRTSGNTKEVESLLITLLRNFRFSVACNMTACRTLCAVYNEAAIQVNLRKYCVHILITTFRTRDGAGDQLWAKIIRVSALSLVFHAITFEAEIAFPNPNM